MDYTQASRAGTEIWLPVPLYENLYEVSNMGRVRALPRIVEHPHTSDGLCNRRGYMLSCAPSLKGYRRVTLHRDGIKKTCKVHRLVYETFVRPANLVRHLDDDKLNCALYNLMEGSSFDNAEDARRNKVNIGRLKVGEARASAKLKEKDVRAIKNYRRSGLAITDIANKYPQVNKATVESILSGKTWTHVLL